MILEEMESAVCRLAHEGGKAYVEAAAAAKHRRSEMQKAFPDSEVDGYEVRVRASIIVTANLADFPVSSLAPHKLEAKTADQFLVDLLTFDERLVLEAIVDMTAQKQRPPMTELEMLQRVGKSAPNFAAAALMLLQ